MNDIKIFQNTEFGQIRTRSSPSRREIIIQMILTEQEIEHAFDVLRKRKQKQEEMIEQERQAWRNKNLNQRRCNGVMPKIVLHPAETSVITLPDFNSREICDKHYCMHYSRGRCLHTECIITERKHS